MLRKTFFVERSAMMALLVLGVLLGAALAQTESELHSFCAHYNCNDGEFPQAGLLLDQKGNLYGTTSTGGPYDECGNHGGEGCGLVFKLSPKGKETVLYDFCERGYPCTDGATPLAGLIFDRNGNLYGTTEYGGAHGAGAAFKLTPDGKYAVLYSFCARDNCTDGYNPAAGMVLDQKGNLYGTTPLGGADGAGVVFRLTPEGKETVLYSLCADNNCTDGYGSVAGLVLDQKGNIYGTTEYGGAGGCYGGCGVVFELTPEGKYTVLYSFCAQSGCTDGANPQAGLVFDQKGNLYGTTSGGGIIYNHYCPYEQGCGVVFKLTPKDKETVLYSFCPQNCADGYFPVAGLTVGQNGNLYGTTTGGGVRSAGVVFTLTSKGKETVLYNFCAQTNCADGANPYAGLVLDQKGNLYGTTNLGGAYESGTAFKLKP
jgi:uncharacterized repeat protein (TIGR03803 family)